MKFLVILFGSLLIIGCEPKGELDNKKADSVQEVVGQKPTTIEEYNELIKKSPNDPELYLERANLKLISGQVKEAIDDADRALVIDSTNPDFHVFKGGLYMQTQQLRKAKKSMEKALKIDFEHEDANLYLAEMYIMFENYDAAFNRINNALRKNVHNAKAYYLKGILYVAREDYQTAVSSFQTCIEQDPKYYDGYIELGLLYAKANDDLAITYYDNAIKINSQIATGYYNKGIYLQQKDSISKAYKVYHDLIKNVPENPLGYYNLGYLNLINYGDLDSAKHYFNLTIRLAPRYADAYYNLGLTYETLEKNDTALTLYRNTLKLKPDHTLAAKGVSRLE